MFDLKKINKEAVKSISRIEGATAFSTEEMAKVKGGGHGCTYYAGNGEWIFDPSYD